MKIKLQRNTIKKILQSCGLTSLAITTIGFTLFGIGAGGNGTNVSSVSVSASAKAGLSEAEKTVLDNAVQKANTELKTLPRNTGFLSTKGNGLSGPQIHAIEILKGMTDKKANTAGLVAGKTLDDKLMNDIDQQLKIFGTENNGSFPDYDKIVQDNKTFFNIGVTLFSIGAVALIASYSYYIFFKYVFMAQDSKNEEANKTKK